MDLLLIVSENPFLYTFALCKPPGHKILKQPRTKLLKKIKESVLSHIIFYLEDNNNKAIDFVGETTSFDCQIIKL